MNRIRQFIRAVTARASDEDRKFASKYLSPELMSQFLQMSEADQRHAIGVAKTAAELAAGKENVDADFLMRCALVHDIGRKKGDLGVFGKSIAVIAHHFFPTWSRRIGDGFPLRKNSKMFHIYYHHAEVGGEILKSLGYIREAAVVSAHHSPETEDDPVELRILRRSDDAN